MLENKPIHVKPSLYAFYFEVVKQIGLKYGYNIVLHGSMQRDLDLVALPWEETLGDKELMLDEIASTLGGEILIQNKSVDNMIGERFSTKPHGRKCYIININRRIELKYDGMMVTIVDHASPQFYLDISIF